MRTANHIWQYYRRMEKKEKKKKGKKKEGKEKHGISLGFNGRSMYRAETSI